MESETVAERSRQTRLNGVLDGFLFHEFFAMIAVLGVANEHVLERKELKWCDVPPFVNTIATTIQGAKK